MMSQIVFQPVRTETISFPVAPGLAADILRLDEIHPVVSGNKWYKLKEYFADAQSQNKKVIVTYGGAFSNHIVATAAACKLYGFQSVGLIRGEKATVLSHSLHHATDDGMKLFFLSRGDYREKSI